MANPTHVALVQQGAAAITAWREAHPDERLDLEKADLARHEPARRQPARGEATRGASA